MIRQMEFWGIHGGGEGVGGVMMRPSVVRESWWGRKSCICRSQGLGDGVMRVVVGQKELGELWWGRRGELLW
jgi:hypothetical protein